MAWLFIEFSLTLTLNRKMFVVLGCTLFVMHRYRRCVQKAFLNSSLHCAPLQFSTRKTGTEIPRLKSTADHALQESKKMLGNQPFIISRALDTWPASTWCFSDLLRVSGEVAVPVEASFNGGDYRDLLSDSPTDHARGFQPDVLVPLRVLIEHIQDMETTPSPSSTCSKDAGSAPPGASERGPEKNEAGLHHTCAGSTTPEGQAGAVHPESDKDSSSQGPQASSHIKGDSTTHGAECRSRSTTHGAESRSGSKGDSSTHAPDASSNTSPPAAEPSSEREVLNEDKAEVLLYLAQHDIRDVLPQVAEGLGKPLFAEVEERLHKASIWLGPRGTVTPLHCDPYHNLFCQLIGRKRIRVYTPSMAGQLELFARPVVLRNTSRVRDIERLEVPYQECVLEPGDVLHIPKKWFHHVTALEGSLSVSFWWT
jgi:hypothetical protein